jgi:predicted DCC family thiol-disulfide oxidoreductase YuxK
LVEWLPNRTVAKVSNTTKLMRNSPLTVLYDGGCPLCSREIAQYRRLDRAERVRWIDVTQPGADLDAYGVTQKEAMAVFHVIDRSGKMHKGVRGFLILWDEFPRYRSLAKLVRALHAVPLLEWGYGHFARWHFRHRCDEGACL